MARAKISGQISRVTVGGPRMEKLEIMEVGWLGSHTSEAGHSTGWLVNASAIQWTWFAGHILQYLSTAWNKPTE